MLLETDTRICPGAYVTVSSSPANPPDSDGSRSDTGNSVNDLGAEVWTPPPPLEMWLVGLEARTTDGRPVWRYYVVDHALDPGQASHTALQRADSAAEKATWGRPGGVGRIGRVEVRRILQDVLGNVTLARRS